MDVEAFFLGLPQHHVQHHLQALDGLYQFVVDGTCFSVMVANGVCVRSGAAEPVAGHGTLVTRASGLEGMVEGRLDPMDYANGDLYEFRAGTNEPPDIPAEDSEGVRHLTLLLQWFNAAHLTPWMRDHPVLGKFYRTGRATDAQGKQLVTGGWSLTARTVNQLVDVVAAHPVTSILEIGLAYGISSLAMLHALASRKDTRLVAIDPWQQEAFHGVGALNVARGGGDTRFTLMEQVDYLALPRLVEKQERFDLVFIDGLHLMDHVLLDFFYADLMLSPGGLMIFDDRSFPGVAPAVSYVLTNRAYQELPSSNARMAVLQKTGMDDRAARDVTFHQPF